MANGQVWKPNITTPSLQVPNTVITEISRDRKEYEVELSNSLELTFDSKSFFLTDYDD